MQVLPLRIKLKANKSINRSRIVSGNLDLQLKSSGRAKQVGKVIGRPEHSEPQNWRPLLH
jgi:hypothetical protein